MIARHVAIPTIGQDCDVHLRLEGDRIAYAGVYDHARGVWYTTVDYSLTATPLLACLSYAGVTQRQRATMVPVR